MSDRRVRVVVAGEPSPGFPTARFGERIELDVARTDEELRSMSRAADVMYTWKIPDTVPRDTPALRWIQLPSAGADHVRNTPVWNSDILLTSSRGIHTVPMAEHTFAMLLGLARQIPSIVRAGENREWIHDARGGKFGELRAKTLGIVGWGKIGEGIAHLASAFGMRVIGTRWSVLVPREEEKQCGAYADPPWLEPVSLTSDIVYPAAQLYEVLDQSDVIVVILPLTSETEGLIGEAEFRAMKRGAIFVNIGRGAVVVEEALVAALRSGKLAGAGLDVFETEPLHRSSPLWTMSNVIVSPHVGGMSDQTRDRAARFFAVNLARYLDGESLLNVVDRAQEY